MGEVREIFGKEVRDFVDRKPLVRRMEMATSIAAQTFADDLAGFVLVAVNVKGECATHWAVDPDSPVGPTMLTGIAQGAIVRDIVSEIAIKNSLIRNGLVYPDQDQD